MTLASVLQHARHPAYALRRIGYRLYEATHPDEPWIAQGAVRFCASQLKPSMRGFEWGSGRSTAWFARRVGHLTSVEHDQQWYGIVHEQLRARDINNVTYRLIPLSHPAEEPSVPVYSPLPPYIAAVDAEEDGALGLVVVDGHYRQACIAAALPKIAPGGLLLVDNTNWLPLAAWGVPAAWPIVHQSRNVMTETTIWRRPQ
jgi:predicted O-methyltransferase YrrM